jgi:hypothetical protein
MAAPSSINERMCLGSIIFWREDEYFFNTSNFYCLQFFCPTNNSSLGLQTFFRFSYNLCKQCANNLFGLFVLANNVLRISNLLFQNNNSLPLKRSKTHEKRCKKIYLSNYIRNYISTYKTN